ncbi:MAG: replication factor C large subunit [Nanopusillaceae archaeon]
MKSLWIKKYAPKNSYEIVNQSDAISEIKDFILKKYKDKKGLLLYGPPGTGKTCSVYAIANELNYEVVEINASDFRTAKVIHERLDEAIKGKTFFYKGRIILIDEIDGLAGFYDKGGIGAIINIIEESKWPVILTANDPWDPKFKKLRDMCKLVEFKKLSTTDIFKALKRISLAEKLDVDDEVLKSLAQRSQGDMRSAINDLQTLSNLGKRITMSDLVILGYRDREIQIFQALGQFFKSTTLNSAKNIFMNLDMDPEEIEAWIEENIANEYENIDEIFEAYDWMSKARIFYGRIYVRQYWDLLKYYTALMYGGVALAKKQSYRKFTKYRMPMLFRKLSKSKETREKVEGILKDLKKILHTSTKRIREVYINLVYSLSKLNENLAKEYLKSLNLKESEVEYIIELIKNL